MVDALNYIRLGYCDVIVTGGSEAGVNIAGMAGFNAMHALSTRNDSLNLHLDLLILLVMVLYWVKVLEL